jgi:hypothetical protein
MTDVYNKNFELLKGRYPDLAQQIIQCDDRYYHLFGDRNGTLPNLIYSGSDPDTVFYERGDPSQHAYRLLKKAKATEARFVVILGMGLGYAALELLEKNKQLIKVIIVEKDVACLKKAMEVIDLQGVLENPSVALVVGCPEPALYTEIHHAVDPFFIGLKEVAFFPWHASLNIAPYYYSQVVKTFSDVADIWIAERGNDPYDTLVAYEQFLMNMGAYLNNPGASHVHGFFRGRPAIVAATGPSLKTSLHLLKEAENSAVIVSADASFKILRAADIKPHFIATVERPPGPAMFYEGMDALEKTVLAVVSFAHPSTIAAYTGPKILLHRHYRFMDELGLQEDCTQMGLSTANMAYEVARHMGCDPIILVGNDLCFDASGNTHSAGFIHGERQELFEDMDRFEVPGNYEETVVTCHDWFKCIKTYEKRIAGWDGTLINATAGGARIKGSLVMPLKEVLKKHCSVPFYPRDMIIEHMASWENRRSTDTILTKFNSFIEHADWGIAISQKILPVLTATVLEIEACGKKIPQRLADQIQQTLPHIETVLDNLGKSPIVVNFTEYFHTDILPLLMEWQVIPTRFKDPAWAGAYRLKLAEDFFGAMGQLCASLKAVLEDGRCRLSQMATTVS